MKTCGGTFRRVGCDSSRSSPHKSRVISAQIYDAASGEADRASTHTRIEALRVLHDRYSEMTLGVEPLVRDVVSYAGKLPLYFTVIFLPSSE